MIKGIEKIPVTPEGKKLLEASEANYKRFARIRFQVMSFDEKEVVVKVWQTENPSEKYLSATELVDRVKGVFTDVVPEGVAIRARPIPFKKDDLRNFTVTYVEREMNELGLKPKDLVKLLDIDKSSMSIILNEGRAMTKPHRAMFYYLFKSLRREKIA
jgi:DNA-binding MarR family transcriptional regulator